MSTLPTEVPFYHLVPLSMTLSSEPPPPKSIPCTTTDQPDLARKAIGVNMEGIPLLWEVGPKG
jgi:hypothetical protein